VWNAAFNYTKMNNHCIKTGHLYIPGKHKRLYFNSQKNWYGFDTNAGISLSFWLDHTSIGPFDK
jgi:hypothetical protein